MVAKQIRISDPDQIRQRIGEFLNKNVNLVLKNNTVIAGELHQALKEQVVIINMRLKRMNIHFSDIAELYMDVKV